MSRLDEALLDARHPTPFLPFIYNTTLSTYTRLLKIPQIPLYPDFATILLPVHHTEICCHSLILMPRQPDGLLMSAKCTIARPMLADASHFHMSRQRQPWHHVVYSEFSALIRYKTKYYSLYHPSLCPASCLMACKCPL
jgi:hypothetical protein